MTADEVKKTVLGTGVWALVPGEKEPIFGYFEGYRSEVDRVYVRDGNALSNKRWLYQRSDVFLSREEAMDALKSRSKPPRKDFELFDRIAHLLESNMLRDESEYEQLLNRTALLKNRIEESRKLIGTLREKMKQLEKQDND